MISHDSIGAGGRYGQLSKDKKVSKLLDVYRSHNEIYNGDEVNKTYQSVHKINDIFTTPKLLNPGLNLRNSYNGRMSKNNTGLPSPFEGKRMFLRRGDRNKVMAVNMINNV